MGTEFRIASPCSADWNKMVGDDRVRHCAACNLDVYNFAALTDREIADLVANRQGRLCARLYRRADGTVITQNCPVGFRARVRKVSRIAGAALSAAMSVTFAGAQIAPQNQTPLSMAQQKNARMQVHVSEESGPALEKITILLRNNNTGVEFTGITNSNGDLLFTNLYGGKYSLLARGTGYRSVKFEELILRPMETNKIDVKLRIADIEPLMGELLVSRETLEVPTEQSDIPTRIPEPSAPSSRPGFGR